MQTYSPRKFSLALGAAVALAAGIACADAHAMDDGAEPSPEAINGCKTQSYVHYTQYLHGKPLRQGWWTITVRLRDNIYECDVSNDGISVTRFEKIGEANS